VLGRGDDVGRGLRRGEYALPHADDRSVMNSACDRGTRRPEPLKGRPSGDTALVRDEV
jgi:hypothetical protein